MPLSSIIQSYESVLLQNAGRISSVESSLRSISWLLPGRFQDAELASEGLYSLLNILGLYHDSILSRSLASLPAPLRPSPSSHARYTRHFTTTSPLYNRAAHLLQLISYAELLLEMTAGKRAGKRRADDTVLLLEGIKAVLRLGLLQTTGRAGVQPPIAEREVDPALLEQYSSKLKVEADGKVKFEAGVGNGTASGAPVLPRSAADVVLPSQANGADAQAEYWQGAKTGNTYPSLASLRVVGEPAPGDPTSTFGPAGANTGAREALEAFLKSRVLTAEDATRPQDLVAKARGKAKLAEMIWILRPLVYVLAMRKYGRRHTLPYLVSLSLEYLAYTMRTQAAAQRKAPPSTVEQDETAKRRRAFLWYLLRGPVWDTFTKRRLEGVQATFEDKPLIGFVATLIKDYVPLIDEYYYYTS